MKRDRVDLLDPSRLESTLRDMAHGGVAAFPEHSHFHEHPPGERHHHSHNHRINALVKPGLDFHDHSNRTDTPTHEPPWADGRA